MSPDPRTREMAQGEELLPAEPASEIGLDRAKELPLSQDDPAASARGLDKPTDKAYDPDEAHDNAAKDLARYLFIGAGVITITLIIGAFLIVDWKPADEAAALLSFFATIVSALGTLLGGVVGYYFGKARSK